MRAPARLVILGLLILYSPAPRVLAEDDDLTLGEPEHWQHAEPAEAALSASDLSGANVQGFFLAATDLKKANLSGTNLQTAFLSGADLGGAALRRANLQESDLTGALLENADLAGAILQGANLHGAALAGASLEGAYLQGASLAEVSGLTQEELDAACVDETVDLRGTGLRRPARRPCCDEPAGCPVD